MSSERNTLLWSQVPDDGVGEQQTLQAQVLQEPAAADDALQSSGGDDGAGQIHVEQLQLAVVVVVGGMAIG